MSDFSYLTANRRFSLSFPNILSIRPRFLYFSLSYTICSFRFFRPGITGSLLFPSNSRRNPSLSYHGRLSPHTPLYLRSTLTQLSHHEPLPRSKALQPGSPRSLSPRETAYLSPPGSSLWFAAPFLSTPVPVDFHRRTIIYLLSPR